MQLIADSGSTKTEWVIINGSSKQSIITSGINPFYENSNEILDKLTLEWSIERIIPKEINFYGAGCANAEKNNIVALALEKFFNTKNIQINSDLLGAARSLCQDKEGITCILGTGSNSCYYDGHSIVHNVSPLGFIIGDEGSGAVMGKLLIADILKKQLPPSIIELFFEEHEMNAPEIVDRIYKKPFPNRYLAQFTKFIKSHIDIPELENIVLHSFNDFVQRNLRQYDRITKLPIHFTGSIAYHFKDQLKTILKQHGLQPGTINPKPMEGLELYHTK